MATLGLPGHKRGRSSSTTTAIQRPGSIVLTTRTISSVNNNNNNNNNNNQNRPRRLSNEGMPSLNTSLPLTSTSSSSTLERRRTRAGWLSSMASHVPGVGSYWTSSSSSQRHRKSMEMSESGDSSTPSMISGPPSPAHTAFPHWSPRAANPVPTYSPLLFVILLFPLSTALVIGSVWTLPIRLPSTDDEQGPHSVFPRTVSEVRALAWALKGYSETGSGELIHVLAVLAVTALWKHAWSIPGSVLLNVLTGTLLPPVLATLLQTSLTTLGSVLSTILATPLTPIITRFFPSAIELTRTALEGPSSSSSPSSPLQSTSSQSVLSSSTTLRDSISTRPSTPTSSFSTSKPQSSSSPWARLAVLRLIGIVPWSGINVACGVCGVSLRHCATGAFIGTLPWTAVTCQIGDILQTFASSPVSPNSSTAAHQTISSLLTSPEIIFKLFILTFISLAPILAKERLSAWLNGTSTEDELNEEKEREKEREKEKERLYLSEKRKSRGHRKRFSVEWWRRSLSLSRASGKGQEEDDNGEESLEMLGPDERA